MKAATTEDRSRLNPARTVAMATAFSVHIAAMLFLLAPARPQAQAQLEAHDITEVQFIPPPIRPPPPPKPAPPPPEKNPPPIRPRQPVPPVIERPVATTTTTTVAEDPNIISEVPDSEPVTPPGPANDSFVDARADARYGTNRRVPYPRTALRKREQGEVQLRILISRSGQPLKVELARSSGSRDLDREAQRSVMKWRFVAAERNGEKIESWVLVPIQFNLDEA